MKDRSALVAAAMLAPLLAVTGAGGTTAQTPKLGGTIAVAEPFEPACLNPLLARCADASFAVEKALLPAFDVDARFQYRARLVSRVTVSTKPSVTLTYHIRPQARWSDGVPVTAADFVFTHAARLAMASSLPETERAQLQHVRRVTAVGTRTVRVTLREQFSGWQALFPNVLPRHVLEGEDLSKIWVDHVDEPRTGNPIGDGPFLVEGLERGKALTLVRNPHYWGPHLARVDRLVLSYDFGDPAASLEKGDLDIVPIMRVPEAAAPFRTDPEFRVFSPPSASYTHFAMRVVPPGHPALSNPLVRRALAYGIDREAIVRAVAGPKRPLQSLVYIAQSPYQRSNWQRYERRPALARALLARAGCKRGADGIYSCGGRRLSLRFVTSAGLQERQVILTIVRAQLRKVGIEVHARYVADSAFAPTVLPRGQFDVALFTWFFDPDTASLTDGTYSCRGVYNWTGYCSGPVSRALAQASRTLDPAVQARILNAADRVIAADAPVLPLYQTTLPGVVRASVKGFVKLPYNPLADAENWWLDR